MFCRLARRRASLWTSTRVSTASKTGSRASLVRLSPNRNPAQRFRQKGAASTGTPCGVKTMCCTHRFVARELAAVGAARQLAFAVSHQARLASMSILSAAVATVAPCVVSTRMRQSKLAGLALLVESMALAARPTATAPERDRDSSKTAATRGGARSPGAKRFLKRRVPRVSRYSRTRDRQGCQFSCAQEHLRGFVQALASHDAWAHETAVPVARFNLAFREVMLECGREQDQGTWILPEMVDAYCVLYEVGRSHSVEAWQSVRLVAGSCSVQLGALFAAEPMFHRERDASEVALITEVQAFFECRAVLFDV